MKGFKVTAFSLVVCLVACSEGEPELKWHSGAETELIAFIRETSGAGMNQIFVMNPDGSNVRLQETQGAGVGYTLAWSPDARSIAFQGYALTPPQLQHIYFINHEGITKKPLDECQPEQLSWSPDGSRLAFVSQHEAFAGQHPAYAWYSGYRIYTSALDNPAITPTRAVADTLMSFDWHPSWSPDGKKIAFCSNRENDGSVEIYLMKPDGSAVERITSSPMHKFQPVWSPDGTKIAFLGCGDKNVSCSIYIMDPDGRNLFQVTHNLSNIFLGLTWSPDGKRLAFISDHESNREAYVHHEADPDIYVVNIDGTGLRRLTTYSGREYSPSWSRGRN